MEVDRTHVRASHLIEDSDEGERELSYSLGISLSEQLPQGGVGQIAQPVRERAEADRNSRQHHLHRPDAHKLQMIHIAGQDRKEHKKSCAKP